MTRARELGKLANKNSLTADNTNNFVGIGSTQPDARLDVDGTVLVGTAITIGWSKWYRKCYCFLWRWFKP